MFRFFENLVDPYTRYEATDVPSQRLLPFLIDYTRPFRRVFWITGALSVIVAIVEIWLLGYLGRLVNILSDGVKVISVPLRSESLTFFNVASALPSLYFWVYSPPSLQTLKVSSFERALTTETPTPCRPPEN